MKQSYAFRISLIITNILVLVQSLSEPDIKVGYEVTLGIPSEYTKGFLGRAFLIQTQQTAPFFRAAISVEAVDDGKYCCSLDIFLGDVKVWSSGHLSRFYTSDKCVIQLTQDGNLRLKGPKEFVGWRSGTSGQGVTRLVLLRTGNLVLVDASNLIKWQSFNFPTDIMLWGQRLSSKTRLTSFPVNSTLFYSMEIQDDKIALFLNSGASKYSYWEYRPNNGEQKNITFASLTSDGLNMFNGRHKFDEIKPNGPEPIRFLALDKDTGNLRLYRYSEERDKFEASYQALAFTCDLPLACEPYGICTSDGSCSCIRGSNCKNESLEGKCGKKNESEMVEIQGVVSVMRSVPFKDNVGNKEECARVCLDDCNCVGAEYGGSLGECYLYNVARGIKQVEKGDKVIYMVKVGKMNDGHGKNNGLKRWVIVLVGVVDGFIIFVVLGGVGYYVISKRKNRTQVGGQAT